MENLYILSNAFFWANAEMVRVLQRATAARYSSFNMESRTEIQEPLK